MAATYPGFAMSRATLGQSLTGLSIVLPLAYCLVRAARLRLGGSRARERHGAAAGGSAGARAETSLDPPDAEGWAELRAEAHALLDASLDRMQSAREGRVWTPMPEQMRAELAGASPPSVPVGRTELASRLKALLPYGVGNTHPRFFGWVHGSGCPGVVLPELVAAAMNANCGGRDHAGVHVERQVLGWCKTLMGFPADAGGLLVSGTSMATLIALKVARDHCCAHASRAGGVVAAGRLCGYTSNQAHSCLSLAFDVLGMGSAQLRQVATGAESFEMDLVALADAVAADRRAGLVPFFVAGTAGTVSVGAVDDLDAIADFCRWAASGGKRSGLLHEWAIGGGKVRGPSRHRCLCVLNASPWGPHRFLMRARSAGCVPSPVFFSPVDASLPARLPAFPPFIPLPPAHTAYRTPHPHSSGESSSGSTWTAPSALRRCCRPWLLPACRACAAPTRWPSTSTSGCTWRTMPAVCWCAMATRTSTPFTTGPTTCSTTCRAPMAAGSGASLRGDRGRLTSDQSSAEASERSR